LRIPQLFAPSSVVGVVIAAVVAAASGPVLDAMGVSAPAARLAAGAVLAVAAIVHLVRRPPLHVGLVAAPVVLLAAGRDAGVLVVSLAAIVAATAATVHTASPALRWVTRGTAAALLAIAVALGVAGVLAV
jgi:small neutral amino acid transporter SnatA (MarC family)